MPTTLPAELLEDILRRLPVKSLKRFRAVAKWWCCLIDSESFANIQLRHSLIANSNRNLVLGGLALYSIDLGSLDKAHVVKPPFYYKSVDGISNSCNGIVLVMSDPPVLWNPFSRGYKILPDCGGAEESTPPECYSKTAYGFGYDSGSDDYRVVRVVEFRHTITHFWMGCEARIYGLRSNSWKRIEGFTYPLPFLRGNWRVHVNGALHTLVEDPENMDSASIMGFSVETEKHERVMMPQGIKMRGVDVSLDVMEGCLSLVCTNRYRTVIWVMREYGVRESWTKLLSISPPAIERNDFLKPLVYSRDGDKVLLNCDDKRLIWYDLKNKSVEDVNVDGLPFVFYAEVCVESLVSLDGPDEVNKKGKEPDKKKGIEAVKKKGKEAEKNKEKISRARDDFLSEGFKLVL